jgi:hypothetical protein
MPQRLNWTNRRRIERSDVEIAVTRGTDGAAFNARLDLASYGLPTDCRVVVEAYRQTTWRRFEFGTVGFIRPLTSTQLADFGDVDGVQFRVKVLSGDGREDGRIWAEADRIPITDSEERETGRRSLLNTRSEDLEEVVWRLDFDESRGGPMLVVNSRLGDWRAAVRSPQFRSLVYPELLRRVLERALDEFENEESGWSVDWIKFAARLPGVSEQPDSEAKEDDKTEWAADAVRAFCRQQRFAEKFGTMLKEEGEP